MKPPSDSTRGLAYGLLGVMIFALTLPMTRLAVGDSANPQLPPAFVTAGRAAVASLLSAVYLMLLRPGWPPRQQALALALSALGTVIGFPLGIALALREVEATHAAVVTGLLPLATAVLAALSLRQRPSAGFWACALLGCALVIGFAAWKGGGHLSAADGWLLMAVAAGAVGYVAGARAAAVLPAPQVICWVLVGSLPFTLPAMVWFWPSAPARATAWLGFTYAALFSMWLGFFAWYHGLTIGGVVRVSQVQLLQPFLSLLCAVPLLGERLDPATVGFAAAVVAVVFLIRRMPVDRPVYIPAKMLVPKQAPVPVRTPAHIPAPIQGPAVTADALPKPLPKPAAGVITGLPSNP